MVITKGREERREPMRPVGARSRHRSAPMIPHSYFRKKSLGSFQPWHFQACAESLTLRTLVGDFLKNGSPLLQ